MKEIIEAIKKDITFSQEQCDYLYQQALNRYEDHTTVGGVYPMMLEEVNQLLDEGYKISPLHIQNQMRQGFIQISLRKPDSLIKQEKAALKKQVKENYEEQLVRTQKSLIEQAIEDVLAQERQAQIDALKAVERAREQEIRESLMAGVNA